MTNPTPDEMLDARGLKEAAKAAGWTTFSMTIDNVQYPGWKIPCFARDGRIFAYRWKNAAPDYPEGTKYRWYPEKPKKLTRRPYYLPPGTLDAIKEAGGVVYLASGEPDVLAYRAAGILNTICWFDGENSVPTTLDEDLTELGITDVLHFPDQDETGLTSAAKVKAELAKGWITYRPLALPAEQGSKYDINKLWIDVGFDSTAFTMALEACPPLTLPKLSRNEQPKTTPLPDADDWFEEYVTLLKSDSRLQGTHREGNIMRFQCVNPGHDDQHPSARISYEKDTQHGIYVCNCESSISWTTVGEWLGVRWEDFKARKKEAWKAAHPRTSAEPVSAAEPPSFDAPPAGETEPPRILEAKQFVNPELLELGVRWEDIPIEQMLFSSDDAKWLFEQRMKSLYIMPHKPTPFPFRAFWPLGGVFRVGTPGQIYGMLGLSGYGKSSFIESGIDINRQDGDNAILISPELPWWKQADRLVQRQGGMTSTESLLNDLYLYEKSHGDVRFGEAAPQTRIDEALKIIEWSTNDWPGKVFMLDQYGASFRYLMAAVYKAADVIWRWHGRRINRLYLDYIQLMKAPPEWRGMVYEDMLNLFVGVCAGIGATGYVASQVRKADTTAVIKEGAKTTDQDAGMYIRDFSFKGYATMTPGFKKDPITGKQVVANYTVFNCTKNSEGKAGEIELETVWSRMLFKDHDPAAGRGNTDTDPRLKPEASNGHKKRAKEDIDSESVPEL